MFGYSVVYGFSWSGREQMGKYRGKWIHIRYGINSMLAQIEVHLKLWNRIVLHLLNEKLNPARKHHLFQFSVSLTVTIPLKWCVVAMTIVVRKCFNIPKRSRICAYVRACVYKEFACCSISRIKKISERRDYRSMSTKWIAMTNSHKIKCQNDLGWLNW